MTTDLRAIICDFFIFLFFDVYLFYGRESVGRGGTEREEERIPSRLHAVNAEPSMGLDFMNPELMT